FFFITSLIFHFIYQSLPDALAIFRTELDGLEFDGRNLIPDSKNVRLRTNSSSYPLTVTKLENGVWELLPGDGVGISTYFPMLTEDRKSTRLNFSHVAISYAVFCLK